MCKLVYSGKIVFTYGNLCYRICEETLQMLPIYKYSVIGWHVSLDIEQAVDMRKTTSLVNRRKVREDKEFNMQIWFYLYKKMTPRDLEDLSVFIIGRHSVKHIAYVDSNVNARYRKKTEKRK